MTSKTVIDHGHKYARTHSLDETSGQENIEGGSPSAKQGSDGKDTHGEEEEAAYREAVLKIGSNGNHDRVHEREARGKPLARRRIDGHLGHDGGKRWRDKRLVENRDKSADHDNDQHHPLLSAETHVNNHPLFRALYDSTKRKAHAKPAGDYELAFALDPHFARCLE